MANHPPTALVDRIYDHVETPANVDHSDAQLDAEGSSLAPQPPPPRHAQQLSSICAELQLHKQQGLAWVPECMEAYMRTALDHAARPPFPISSAAPAAGNNGSLSSGIASSGSAPGAAQAAAAPQHLVALGTQEHMKGSGAKAARWVMQVGLLIGSPGSNSDATTASCGGSSGTSLTPEYMCRLLAIEDTAPANISRTLQGALAKGELVCQATGECAH